jgi:8-oxo-dGTP pyrophosphatase MutT (NUDIX family)
MEQRTMAESRYETLSSHYLWTSRWYNLRQDEIVTPDGSHGTYTVVEHPGAVWVVPVTTDGLVILEWQYRYTVQDWCWEVPAGGLLPDVPAEEMAARELREEIGGTTGQLEHIAWFYTMNGIGTEVAHVYLARDVELGEPARESTEVMEIRAVPIAEALRMAREGEITDGPSALALLLCERELEEIARGGEGPAGRAIMTGSLPEG